ncbi:hypothetical protein [Pseudomonas sp. PS1(2021)]|uniref:hypothetical protein n=1 Tax=Pseudomonas sp. PS1(2021) TaxID=2866282 RepID=UPI0039A697FB
MSTLSYTLGQLAAHVGAELRGDADLPIQGLATLQEAGPAQLSFWPTRSIASTCPKAVPAPSC